MTVRLTIHLLLTKVLTPPTAAGFGPRFFICPIEKILETFEKKSWQSKNHVSEGKKIHNF